MGREVIRAKREMRGNQPRLFRAKACTEEIDAKESGWGNTVTERGRSFMPRRLFSVISFSCSG